ncbi:MAG TPA: METTL5 family protein [Candidatus Bathyarchaeia archaeon]|nr:METTL5 family protein [Candidatus Bathyarchaeia archaeon]
MKQRQLEIILEQVQGFESPSATYEQYPTSAPVAARLLHFAYMQGDIDGVDVVDLGCGTGVLALGAALLGGIVTGVDSDKRALNLARKNAKLLGVHVSWQLCRVEDFEGSFETVVMNPPFGAQQRGSDRPFLSKSVCVGKVVYLLHNAVVNGFVRRFLEPHRITDAIKVKLPIAHTFKFHKDEVRYVDAIIYRIEVAL